MHIRINGTEIKSDGKIVVKGNHGPDKLRFLYDKTWDTFVKYAQFTQNGTTYNVLQVDNECSVPDSIRPGVFYLNVTGITPNSDKRVVTGYIVLHLQDDPHHLFPPLPPEPPRPDEPGDPSRLPPPPPVPGYQDLYRELMEKIEEACRRGGHVIIDPSLSKHHMAAEANAVGVALEMIRQTMAGDKQTLSEQIDAASQTNDTQTALINSIQRQMDTVTETTQQTTEAVETMQSHVGELETRIENIDQSSASTESMTELENRVTTLETNSATKDSVEALSQKQDIFERTQNALSTTVGNHTASLQALRTDVDSHTERLNNDETRITALEASSEGTSTLAGRVTNAEANITSLQQGLAANTQATTDNATAIADLKNRVTNTEQKDIAQDAAILTLQNADLTINERVSDMESAVQNVRGNVDALTQNVGTYTSSMNTMRQDIVDLQSGLRQTNNNVSSNTTSITRLERRMTDVERVADAAEDKAEDNASRLETVEDNVRNIKTRIDLIENSTIADLQATDRATATRINCLTERVDAAETSIGQAKADIRTLTNQMQSLSVQVSDVETAVSTANANARDAKSAVNALVEQNLNSRLNTAESAIRSMRSESEEADTAMTRDISSLTNRVRALEEAATGHEDEQAHASDIRILDNRITNLETNLTRVDESKATKTEVTALNTTVREHTTRMDRLETRVGVNEEHITNNHDDIQRLLTGHQELMRGQADNANAITTLQDAFDTYKTNHAAETAAIQEGLEGRIQAVEAAETANISALQETISEVDGKVTAVASRASALESANERQDTELTELRESTVKTEQGVENAGKVLVVNAEGKLEPQLPPDHPYDTLADGTIVVDKLAFRAPNGNIYTVSFNNLGQMTVSVVE